MFLLFRIHYPPSAQGGNDYCYRLHHQGLNWHDAKAKCEGGLLFLTDMDEYEFVLDQILVPQAERSVIWLAGMKDLDGNDLHSLLTPTINYL